MTKLIIRKDHTPERYINGDTITIWWEYKLSLYEYGDRVEVEVEQLSPMVIEWKKFILESKALDDDKASLCY